MRASPLVRRALGVAVTLGLLTTLAIVVQAVALASAIGALFTHHDADISTALIWLVGATLVRAICVGAAEPVTARLAAPARRDLRRRLLGHVLRRGPLESVDATVQLATRGVDALESYLATYVPSLVLAALAPTLLLGFLVWRDTLSAVIVVISVALLPVFMVLLGLAATDKMRERWHDQQRLAGYFGDVVRGMATLKAHNRSSHHVAQLDEAGRRLEETTMATLRVAFLSSFALELLSSLATALVALTLGIRLLDGSLRLSVALAVLLVTPEVYLPLRRSAAQYHGSSDGIAAATALLDALEASPVATSLTLGGDGPVRVELRDLDLGDGMARVSATIAAGELVVVRGPSGSGKTTLLRTVCGLRTPQRGEVLLDGVDLVDLDLATWHDRVAYLPQDPHLPGSSAREVLSMGEGRFSDVQMRRVLDEVDLDLDLDRPVGEGAAALSAGQRRRLAFARCLLRSPDVLVLDEPTAHLDVAHDELLRSLIAGLGATRLVATHRDFAADVELELAPETARV